MRVNEEGFQVGEADLVTEWGEADSFSRLLGSSFCGWPPETSGSKRGGKFITVKAGLGLMTGTLLIPRGSLIMYKSMGFRLRNT